MRRQGAREEPLMRSIDMKDVFQTLFAVAWADGELREREKTFLADLLERSEVGAEVTGWFDEPPPVPQWDELRSDPEAARGILRQAMYTAAADQTVQYEEQMLMDRLREQLGVSQQDFHDLQQDVERERA